MGDLSLVNGFTSDQIHEALTLALRYESRGWQVLPSASDRKKPLVTYAAHWEGGLPSVRELWSVKPSGNVQVMLGSTWNLCAIDCDGPEGIATFKGWLAERGIKSLNTWTVSNNIKEGLHLWFRLPTQYIGRPFPKKLLWGKWDPEADNGRGDWEKRAAIEFLCDRSLVMAPPSINPRTGLKYRFHAGGDPLRMAYPAVIPAWLLGMPDIRSEHTKRTAPASEMNHGSSPLPPAPRVSGSLEIPVRFSEVLEAIPDKEALAVSWGLTVVAKHEQADGWKASLRIGREEKNASASFRPRDGRYWEKDFNGDRSICFFRLGVELGQYASWRECCVDMGRRFLPHIFSKGK